MEKVQSKDGTTIAFYQLGEGAPLVLVAGASCDRSIDAPIAEYLARHFTVLNYDRRGRGDSGDTLPFAVEREIEDIGVLLAAAGGPGSVSSKSLMSNTKRRSGEAYAPKLDRCASPHSWVCRPGVRVVWRSAAMTSAAPR